MFKPSRRGFLQTLFVAPVVAAAVEAPKSSPMTLDAMISAQQQFIVPQNPFHGPILITGLYSPREIQ